MSLLVAQALCPPEEYLVLERGAFERHEWLDGFVYAMAHENPEHSMIGANLIASLANQLRGQPCRSFMPTIRVCSGLSAGVSTKGLFAYPDVLVICGPPRFHDQHRDVIINPTVIVEILSPSTEAYDRGEKFARYQENASLADYVLVAQAYPRVEHYSRLDNGSWKYVPETSLTGSLPIASIDCRLALAEIYDGIEFPPALNAAPNK